jgi:hypothetical protein
MSGLPRFRNLAKGANGFFLGPLYDLPPGTIMGPTDGFAMPTVDQQPMDLQQLAYIGWAVMKWKLTFSITETWIGEGDGPDPFTLSSDDTAVSAITWGSGGPSVDSPTESLINMGMYFQAINWSDGGLPSPSTAAFRMTCGFPWVNPTVGNEFPPLFTQSGQAFLGWGGLDQSALLSIQLGSPGSGAVLRNWPYSGGPPYTTSAPDSGIDFDILGVSQTLWNPNPTQYSYSGSVSLGAASGGFWTYGGLWDSTTGLPS